MAHSVVEVHPDEVRIITLDFAQDLTSDTEISGTTMAAVDSEGNGASIATLLGENAMIATITLSGFEDGEDYQLTVNAPGVSSGAVGIRVLEVRARSTVGPF